MRLSKYIRPAPDFAEFGFRCASNLVGQAIAANTVTVLNINTLITDSAGIMSAPASNVFTIPAGVWHIEAWAVFSTAAQTSSAILTLFDKTNSKNVAMESHGDYSAYRAMPTITTQINLATPTNFELRILANVAGATHASPGATNIYTVATADTDQRASVKLWRLE